MDIVYDSHDAKVKKRKKTSKLEYLKIFLKNRRHLEQFLFNDVRLN